MGVSPGTGAGIGIALGLLVLFIAGPGAYYYRKKNRRQIEEARQLGSRDADILSAGEDYFGGVKPQLDGRALSPGEIQRMSNSTFDDGPIAMSEAAGTQRFSNQAVVANNELTHPSIVRPDPNRPRIPELHTSNDGRRPELPASITSPKPIELRTDKSPPVDPIAEGNVQTSTTMPVGSREEFARSDESMQLPALPGPILPPKLLR